MSDKDILQKVFENTEVIKQNTSKLEEKNKKLQEELNEIEEKKEERKEQLREAQKSFKKIGCNVKEEVADRFKELAHKLNYPNTSSMCRTYMMLLLEIEKLEYRKKITEKALSELFEIILELEKNIGRDIDTLPTTCKVSIKAEDNYVGEWLNSCAEDDKFSLFVQNGKIKIKNIFSRIKIDENGEKIEIKLSHSFNYFNEKDNKDKKIIKINFLQLIEALKEVINLSSKEALKIDSDAQEFIDFCTKWKSK